VPCKAAEGTRRLHAEVSQFKKVEIKATLKMNEFEMKEVHGVGWLASKPLSVREIAYATLTFLAGIVFIAGLFFLALSQQ
jgi:hypothetical protein